MSICLLSACNSDKTVEVVKEVAITTQVQPAKVTQVKNLILMIGDAMGPQQVGLLEEYARRAPNSSYNGKGKMTALSSAR